MRFYFFDTNSRQIQSLYTDACLYGLGGFYFKGSEPWTKAKIFQENAFQAIVQGKSLPVNRKMKKNPNDLSINVHEVKTILFAFWILSSKL